MIVPLLAAAYLGVGIYKTQRGRIAHLIHPTAPVVGPSEPLWHALVWPAGLFVAGK